MKNLFLFAMGFLFSLNGWAQTSDGYIFILDNNPEKLVDSRGNPYLEKDASLSNPTTMTLNNLPSSNECVAKRMLQLKSALKDPKFIQSKAAAEKDPAFGPLSVYLFFKKGNSPKKSACGFGEIYILAEFDQANSMIQGDATIDDSFNAQSLVKALNVAQTGVIATKPKTLGDMMNTLSKKPACVDPSHPK